MKRKGRKSHRVKEKKEPHEKEPMSTLGLRVKKDFKERLETATDKGSTPKTNMTEATIWALLPYIEFTEKFNEQPNYKQFAEWILARGDEKNSETARGKAS